MKKYITVIFSILLLIPQAFSQNNSSTILLEIEKNNTTLSALKKSVEAEKLDNKIGTYLQNPEFEFNYLWGNPSILGNRIGISLRQSFDFPTAYGFRKEISNTKNEQVDLEYQKQLKSILLEARLLCIDLVHTNALKLEFSKRLIHAQRIANSYKSKFEHGEANILEYNKAQLNALNLNNEIESLDIEGKNLLSELIRLNGGKPIEFNDASFQALDIPTNFEQWYALMEKSNPLLNWLKQEVEIMQNQVKLSKALSLPKFSAGYISEKLMTEQFRGVSVGLSIPLWENKNSVKFAAAKTAAIKGIESDNKIQFYNELKALHAKAIGLQKSVRNYRKNLRTFDNSELLKKALDKGEISLIEYILELSIYYDSANKLLQLERDLHKTYAEMNRYM